MKWVGVAILPVLAAFGIWRLVAGADAEAPSPQRSIAVAVSPSPPASPSPEPSPVISEDPSPSPTASPTSKGELQVLNGTAVAGTGIEVARRLEEAGYTVVSTQNASRRYAKTTIFYQPGFKQMAEGVARELGVGTVQPAVENLDKEIPVTVVAGDDYRS